MTGYVINQYFYFVTLENLHKYSRDPATIQIVVDSPFEFGIHWKSFSVKRPLLVDRHNF